MTRMVRKPRFAAVEHPPRQYSGVVNAVQQAAQAADFHTGLERFRAFTSPTAADLRWAGVCLTALGHHPEAALRLQQAINQGERGAAVHLASLYFQQGEMAQALAALGQVEPLQLEPADAALWHRAMTRILWVQGAPRTHLYRHAQQAWTLAADASTDVQVSVATLLGGLHSQFGEHVSALAYLDFAAEQGPPARLPYVSLSRAVSLLGTGQLDEAREILFRSSPDGMPGVLRAELQAQCHWYQGQWNNARAAYEALLPSLALHPRTELRVRLSLLALATRTGEPQAQDHLYRAEHLTNSPFDQAQFDHRAGLWLARTGQPGGAARLERARAAFEDGGYPRETLVTHLALADIHPEQAESHLNRAAQLASTFASPPFLGAEWPLLPGALAQLQALPADAFTRRSLLGAARLPHLALRTLSQAAVEADGVPIRLRMARTVEILAYFCRQGPAPLARVRRELFPDTPAQRAKNYFHQVRVEVAERLPGVSIAYDAATQLYQLEGAALAWDVHDLERALQEPQQIFPILGTVDFLPGAESDWAQEERERLRRWVTQVALETMDHWYQAGEYEKCIQLAERLLPLDPLDETLHTFLLNATWYARGDLAARHRYRHSAADFMREVGEVPPTLQQLEQHWRTLN